MAKNTREKRDVDVALGGKILVTDAGGQGWKDAIDGRVAQSVMPSRPFWQPFKVAAGVMKEGQGPSSASNKSHHGSSPSSSPSPLSTWSKIDNHVGGHGRGRGRGRQ